MSTVADALRWWATLTPDTTAIDLRGDTLSYAELDSWASAVAQEFQSAGIQPGDRIAIVGHNTLVWCAAAVAAMKTAAIITPYNARFVADELATLLGDSEPVIFLADADHLERAQKAAAGRPIQVWCLEERVAPLRHASVNRVDPPPGDDDDPTVIVYTSGTSGHPKGVIFTHRTTQSFIHEWSLVDPDSFQHGLRYLIVLPLSTALGIMWGICQVITHGGTMDLEPRFDAAAALRILTERRVTVFSGPPIIFEQIAALPEFAEADLSSLSSCTVGGARVSRALLEAWLEKNVLLRQIYGLTEGGGSVSIMSRERAIAHPEKCGNGLMFTRLRVVDPESGAGCAPGVAGEILVRGPSVFPGYWRNEPATREALRDGWLHTGDIGILDENGDLTYVDRLKDMIISGGLNISPTEIENVLCTVPGVGEAAVIGVADPKFGETPAAIVYGNGLPPVEELIAHCNARLADFKVPRYVLYLDEPLPRMASGKLAKRRLRAQYADLPSTHPRVR